MHEYGTVFMCEINSSDRVSSLFFGFSVIPYSDISCDVSHHVMFQGVAYFAMLFRNQTVTSHELSAYSQFCIVYLFTLLAILVHQQPAKYQRDWSKVNTLNLYLIGAWVKSQLGYQQSCLKCFVIFLSPSRKLPG
jgi:hypothetical protein